MTSKKDFSELLDRQFTNLLPRIEIEISRQVLTFFSLSDVITYPISSAKNGLGQDSGSGCTPSGHHIIRAKIGDNAPCNAVFVGRRATGEIYTNDLATQNPNRDWILTRILWLSGLERGHNRLGGVDTMQRYIYIHGTPDSEPMSIPLSHGCIRMRNADVIDLFERSSVGTRVLIKA